MWNHTNQNDHFKYCGDLEYLLQVLLNIIIPNRALNHEFPPDAEEVHT